ncbi:MAG: hypothetical protein IT166_19515 [Bryobacterales bacterium]|nr:hypothetical protein [Bryobacterales bacterium]
MSRTREEFARMAPSHALPERGGFRDLIGVIACLAAIKRGIEESILTDAG